MKIKDITVREIFDSRGEETIEIGISDVRARTFRAQVPSGKSRGKNEAAVFSYGQAQKSIASLRKQLLRRNFSSVRSVDQFIATIDGTETKKKIGGNTALGISVAFSRALAFEKGKELWELWKGEFFKDKKAGKHPLIFSNLINGGAHSRNNLDIQEYMVVVKPRGTMVSAIRRLIEAYRELGDILRAKYKIQNIPIGDEGGYTPDSKDNFEPIRILEKLIYKLRLKNEFLVGLDAAANNFYRSGMYAYDGERINSGDLARTYSNYFKQSKLLFSIEDPFAENDFLGFLNIRNKAKYAWVVGDDLTVTNAFLIKRFSEEGLINAVIIKPNQIGSISQACEAMNVARERNIRSIVSHRSGETEDPFIIHLARAGNADGVKIGAPVRERITKFNELARVYARP